MFTTIYLAVSGSAGLLKALADQCLESRKVLLCAMTSRVGAHIQYVCLYPSQPTSGLAGFHLTVLPFDGKIYFGNCIVKYSDSLGGFC